MLTLATAEAIVDRARTLEADVTAGRRQGKDPAVQTVMQECLATVDAYLAQLPPAEQGPAGTALARRFLERPTYTPTVAPRKRVIAGRI